LRLARDKPKLRVSQSMSAVAASGRHGRQAALPGADQRRPSGPALAMKAAKEMTMAARAATRSGATRRPLKRRTIAVEQEPTRLGLAAEERDLDDWVEADASNERLDECEMEMLLTGHAATHGAEGEDNWLIETDEVNWSER
jgi:hypothetical protein